MVVSEMGEQWSPMTAPPRVAAMAIIRMSWPGPMSAAVSSEALTPANTGITMGSRMVKVPQEVPVAKPRKAAITKTTAGRKLARLEPKPSTIPATNSGAPRALVMSPIVQARHRIRMAGTICLKPSGRQSISSVKLMERRMAKKIMLMIRAIRPPRARAGAALVLAKAVRMSVPPFWKPTISRPDTQQMIRMMTGMTRSYTLPLGLNFISSAPAKGRSGVV